MDDSLRAIICNCNRYLHDVKDWKSISLRQMLHLWSTDCESSMSCLNNSKDEIKENARESRDIRRLKQMLWKRQDQGLLEELEELDKVISEHLAVNAVE
eukprot:11592246-Karenia_brevis.AAC.1